MYGQPASYMPMTAQNPQNAQNPDVMEAFKLNYHRYHNPGQSQDLYSQQAGAQHMGMVAQGHQQLYQPQYYDPYSLYNAQMYYSQQPGANGHPMQMAPMALPHQPAARPNAYYPAGAPGQGHPPEDSRR